MSERPSDVRCTLRSLRSILRQLFTYAHLDYPDRDLSIHSSFSCSVAPTLVRSSPVPPFFFTLFHHDCDDCLPSVRLGVQVARNAGCRNRTSRTLRPPTRPSNHYIHTIYDYKYTEYDSALVPRVPAVYVSPICYSTYYNDTWLGLG